MKLKMIEESLKKNEASSKTKNIQKASTPPLKRQLTVMGTLQINKMKQDKEAGNKKKKMWQKTLLRLLLFIIIYSIYTLTLS